MGEPSSVRLPFDAVVLHGVIVRRVAQNATVGVAQHVLLRQGVRQRRAVAAADINVARVAERRADRLHDPVAVSLRRGQIVGAIDAGSGRGVLGEIVLEEGVDPGLLLAVEPGHLGVKRLCRAVIEHSVFGKGAAVGGDPLLDLSRGAGCPPSWEIDRHWSHSLQRLGDICRRSRRRQAGGRRLSWTGARRELRQVRPKALMLAAGSEIG
jgi:hypothetical protein